MRYSEWSAKSLDQHKKLIEKLSKASGEMPNNEDKFIEAQDKLSGYVFKLVPKHME